MPAKAKQPQPVTFRHAYLLSGPLVLDDNTTRLQIAQGRVTVDDADTIAALDKRPDFKREENV